ncbi:DUF4402 domain-containing protein [Sphingomonas xanthus]|uniref:DUF4402 domain-containing protein n=1 Tax=Sphingomonas xanthus TaxID=2594473 RepID=A0A516IRL6_9SPHN|nr:DUF4402 domain-containing protein [Sphingomonas xanthus]QDP19509.1 DUF4402 domain-containing protein [Sphingomonas xanthus]
MVRLGSTLMLLAAAALIPGGGPAAAPVAASPKAAAQAQLVRPLTLTRIADMDFAALGVTTGGTATINPFNGTMSLSGGLVALGGTVSPARYAGAATKNGMVNIRVPNQPVLIRRVGGTETLTVGNFTLDGQDKRMMTSYGVFNFAVGARITVPAGTVEGLYTGEIDVTVNYP